MTGDGVKPSGVLASIPAKFTIDTREAGTADIDVVIQVTISTNVMKAVEFKLCTGSCWFCYHLVFVYFSWL